MRILHVFRASVGGLFKHVRDLAMVQRELGHEVGIVCDRSSGGKQAEQALADLTDHCALGIKRIVMPRLPGPGDLKALQSIRSISASQDPDILHGHGAKGGLYTRLTTGWDGPATIYTPHGGALHYSWTSPHGAVFLAAEKLLLRKTSGLSFVCQYERDTFDRKVGLKGIPSAIVHNGLWPNEFEPVSLNHDASDLLFIGELRALKGVDVLIRAIASLNEKRSVSATLVGDGPDRTEFEKLAGQLGVSDLVRFTGAMVARSAFERGRLLVVPSRAESFPYIVIEAMAAHKPIIASDVGGIAEILPGASLVTPDDPIALANALQTALDNPQELVRNTEANARLAADQLNVRSMADHILKFYRDVLGRGKF